MKITRIELRNFKQFSQFTLTCKNRNVLVGPNNAGKSTILDALRLVADVQRLSKRLSPHRRSHPHHGVCATYSLMSSNLSIPLESVNRNYGEEAAEIAVRLENGSELKIQLGAESSCYAYLKTDGSLPASAASFRKAFPLDLVIAPTLGTLEAEEKYLMDATVSSSENTRLAHRHFRNILVRKTDQEFGELAELLKATWPNTTIKKPTFFGTPPILHMSYEEKRIPREVHWAGFGFQVWLQTLLQLTRGGPDAVLVLDEPDIYLHADLQRRLLALVNQKFSQSFIATHSTEIINESSAGDVVSVNSGYKAGRRISTDDNYRDLFRYIGSSENAEFARMSRAKRIVFFEGFDKRIIRRFAEKLGTIKTISDPDTVFLQTGGFGQWGRVSNTSWTLKNIFGMEVKIVALFDRDYRGDDEVAQFQRKITDTGVLCRVLGKKEIENYALVQEVIERLVVARCAERGTVVTAVEVFVLICNTLAEMKIDTQSALMGSAIASERRGSPNLDASTISQKVLRAFEEKWKNLPGQFSIICGKDFISAFSDKVQKMYGVSITINQLIAEMKVSEVDPELKEILMDFDSFLLTSS